MTRGFVAANHGASRLRRVDQAGDTHRVELPGYRRSQAVSLVLFRPDCHYGVEPRRSARRKPGGQKRGTKH